MLCVYAPACPPLAADDFNAYNDTTTRGDVGVERTFTGLPANRAVIVRVWAEIDFQTGLAPATAPIGVRVGGAIATTTVYRSWTPLELTATTDAAGTLTVQLGYFGIVGPPPNRVQLQREGYFDLLQIFDTAPC